MELSWGSVLMEVLGINWVWVSQLCEYENILHQASGVDRNLLAFEILATRLSQTAEISA